MIDKLPLLFGVAARPAQGHPGPPAQVGDGLVGGGAELVELLDSKGKVVCTEGPFDLSKQPVRNNVNIECGKPAAWWLLAAAGAAGITAGVVSNDPASPAR